MNKVFAEAGIRFNLTQNLEIPNILIICHYYRNSNRKRNKENEKLEFP